MNDKAFSLLERLFHGDQISRAEHESSLAGLSTSERNLQAQAFQYIISEKFITTLDPNNTNQNTKYVISEIGKKGYEKERDKRENEWRQVSENKMIETLQLKLLQANIQMAESAITANTAAIRNYEWQRANGNRTVTFIAISALFSLASIIATMAVRDVQTPQLFKSQVQIMDSMRQSLKGIDGSVQKALKDSFYRRH